jgi:tetratricopeptide (TPR) repeat protein
MFPTPNPPAEQSAKADSAAEVLERDVPLSESLVWRRQREFYLHRGLKAWTEDQIPSYITTNPFIAQVYARIVFAYLRDCIELSRHEARPVSSANPLRILELGAGSGKFSYLFLRELTALLRRQGMDPALVRYCMTDAANSVLDEWRRNKYLADLVSTGILTFERLRTGERLESQFLVDGRSRSQGLQGGSLVVIANYVFDSLPQDAFRIDQGQVLEFLMTTSAPDPESQASAGGRAGTHVDTISRLKFSFRNAAVPRERYADSIWNRILDDYRIRLSSEASRGATTVLFPCDALATLQELARFSGGRMLVVAADKGFAHEDILSLSQAPPGFEFHTGDCFSMMVNMDAIGKYFEATGGHALRPDKHTATFNICGFLSGCYGEQFPATESAYRETQQEFGPDDLFTLLAWLNAHMEEMNVPQILAALRLTRWDTTALMRLFPVLARQLRTVVAERCDLRGAALRTWANYYPVTDADNVVAFQCGVILLELKFFEDAAALFRESQKLLGPSAPTCYNLALCAQGMGRHEETLALIEEVCRLGPDFQPARELLRKLKKTAPAKS